MMFCLPNVTAGIRKRIPMGENPVPMMQTVRQTTSAGHFYDFLGRGFQSCIQIAPQISAGIYPAVIGVLIGLLGVRLLDPLVWIVASVTAAQFQPLGSNDGRLPIAICFPDEACDG